MRPEDGYGNDLRIIALDYAVRGDWTATTPAGIVAAAEEYLKFLIGEDDENIPEAPTIDGA